MIRIEQIIEEAERVVDAQPFKYRFSKAGAPCIRALVYDAQNKDDGIAREGTRHLSHLLSAACGNAVGELLERAAVRLGAVRQTPCEFDTGAVRVTGHLDFADDDCVSDVKLVGEKKWRRIQTKADPAHLLQVGSYAVAQDKPFWRLIYVRGSTIFDGSERPEIKVYSEPTRAEIAQELCGTWEIVDRHRKLRTLPERVFGAHPEKFPCGWCDHLERCAPSPEEGSNA